MHEPLGLTPGNADADRPVSSGRWRRRGAARRHHVRSLSGFRWNARRLQLRRIDATLRLLSSCPTSDGDGQIDFGRTDRWMDDSVFFAGAPRVIAHDNLIALIAHWPDHFESCFSYFRATAITRRGWTNQAGKHTKNRLVGGGL